MIEFDRVTKRYGNAMAVRELSLAVPTAKITVVMGLSGSGKTTLIRMVNRMVTPTSGHVRIDGIDVAQLNAVALRRKIGYVMQEVGLLPHKSVLDNVALIARIAGQSRETARDNAVEMLALVGIGPELLSRFPQQLSGGQQQRVGVARALATTPNILLMDEPFGAVDPIVREDLQDELCRIQRELGLTVVLVTHDRNEALKIADQLVVLSDGGHVEQVGSPAEVRSKPANDFVKRLVGL